MIAGVIRRSAPRASVLSIDWSKVSLTCVTDESKAFVLGLKQEVATVDAMHEIYSAQPEPIEWDGYKSFFDNHPEIAKLQAAYESKKVVMPKHESSASSVSSAQPVTVPKDIDWEGGWMSYKDLFDGASPETGVKQMSKTEAKVTSLAALEMHLKDNRTTDETTTADLFKKYPSIEEECDDEIANHEWCTNIK